MKSILQHSSFALALAASAANDDGWIMVFPAGKSEGYDGRGPYILDDMEAVIKASLRPSVDMPIDREHAIDVLPEGAPRPAAGWIKELAARPDGIYARVEWTPAAAREIAEKEYRYISPCFLTDRDTGRVTKILRASLVAVPNLEVKAVAAAETQPKETDMDETLKAIAALLGLAEDAEAAAILEAVKALKGDNDTVKEAVDAPAEATGEEIVEKIEEKIEEQTAAALKKKTAELAAAKNPDPKKFVPIEMFNDAVERLGKLETASAQGKAEAAVAAAMKEGKVTPVMKAWALELAASDPKAFEDYVKAAPVVVKPGASDTSAKPPETAAALDDEQKEICKALGVQPDDFVKTAKKTA